MTDCGNRNPELREVFVLPDPFCGCGVKQKDAIEETADPAGCGFNLDRSGLDEVLGKSLKAVCY
jgi:hypothetical protein